jgi:hypothetical protein
VNHLRRTPALLALLGLLAVSTSHAESLSNTLDVYVFPSAGQDASQQSMDESACYEWAVQNSGSDPFDLAKQQETAEQQAEAQKAAAGSKRLPARRPRAPEPGARWVARQPVP